MTVFQEISRLFKISATAARSAHSVGCAVYTKLPEHVKEILKPLQNSKYTVSSASQRSPLPLPSPIYRTKYAKTFNHWVTSWTCFLINLLIGETSKQVLIKSTGYRLHMSEVVVYVHLYLCGLFTDFYLKVYSACKPLVRRDTNTALHLLPHLIVCVLTESEDNRVPVLTEILSIIEAEPSNEENAIQPSAELQ